MTTCRTAAARPAASAPSEVLDNDLLDTLLEAPRWFDREATLPCAPDHAFRVDEGWTAMVKEGAAGAQVISFFLPGDLVGFDLASTPLIGARLVALTPARLRLSRARARRDLVQHPSLVRLIAGHNLAHHKRLQSHIFRLGAMSALQRMADLYLELYERLGGRAVVGRPGVDLPLRQETIARALGLSLVHVNRTGLSLKAANAAYVDRGRLFVPELAALRAIAQSGAVIPADPDDRAGAEAAEPAEGSQGRAAIAGQPRWESRYPHHGEAALAS